MTSTADVACNFWAGAMWVWCLLNFLIGKHWFLAFKIDQSLLISLGVTIPVLKSWKCWNYWSPPTLFYFVWKWAYWERCWRGEINEMFDLIIQTIGTLYDMMQCEKISSHYTQLFSLNSNADGFWYELLFCLCSFVYHLFKNNEFSPLIGIYFLQVKAPNNSEKYKEGKYVLEIGRLKKMLMLYTVWSLGEKYCPFGEDQSYWYLFYIHFCFLGQKLIWGNKYRWSWCCCS